MCFYIKPSQLLLPLTKLIILFPYLQKPFFHLLVKAKFFIINDIKKTKKFFVLIKNKKIEFFKNVLLILLVINFSASAFFIYSMKKDECCHVKKEEVKTMSCCEMMETKAATDKCSFHASSFEKDIPDCGCIHNYSPTQQTIQIVKTNDIPKVKVIAEVSNEWNLQSVINRTSNTLFTTYKESPPIYLIDSSFLI